MQYWVASLWEISTNLINIRILEKCIPRYTDFWWPEGSLCTQQYLSVSRWEVNLMYMTKKLNYSIYLSKNIYIYRDCPSFWSWAKSNPSICISLPLSWLLVLPTTSTVCAGERPVQLSIHSSHLLRTLTLFQGSPLAYPSTHRAKGSQRIAHKLDAAQWRSSWVRWDVTWLAYTVPCLKTIKWLFLFSFFL